VGKDWHFSSVDTSGFVRVGETFDEYIVIFAVAFFENKTYTIHGGVLNAKYKTNLRFA